MSPHPFVHVELSAKDRQQSAGFYANVFGWKIQDIPEMNYTLFETVEGGLGGGFNPVSEDSPAGTILLYIHTDDLEDTLSKVEANGGTVHLRSYEIANVGWMALFSDPSGNKLALLKTLENMG